VFSDKLPVWLREGESERLSFQLFFGHKTIETLVAFANLRGGVLLLGVSEMREVVGIADAKENIDYWLHEIQTQTTPRLTPNVGLIEINEKIVVYLSVTEYPMKPAAFGGKYYIRCGKANQELSAKEAFDFRRQAIAASWDSCICSNKTISDISLPKLSRQIERISRKKLCPPEEPLAFLRKYGLAEGEAITNACWLLFSPEEKPITTIELGRFSSPTVVEDSLVLKDDLFTEAEEAMHFICKHIRKGGDATSDRWQYPLEAIRELVVNMIIHRDYTSDYDSIIKIFDNCIEFYNSGALPDSFTIKQLLSDDSISQPRNCQIVELFKEAGMFEKYGSGIRQVYKTFADSGLRTPEFIKLPGRLIVRVFGDNTVNWVEEKIETMKAADNSSSQETVAESEVDNLPIEMDTIENQDVESHDIENGTKDFSERVHRIIALLLEDNRVSLNEIARKASVSKRTILRDIKKMKKEKIIERIGNEKSGYWKINQVL
jgi:ATP-dependent DNA helicase RecG